MARKYNNPFGGIGLTNRQRREAKQATRRGTLNEFFTGVDPSSAEAFAGKMSGAGGIGAGGSNSRRGIRRAQMFGERGGFNLDEILANQEPTPTGPVLPEAPPASGPTSGGEPARSMDQMLQDYGYGKGATVQGAEQFITQAANNLANSPAFPTFEELYGSFQKVAGDETNRQANALQESFGSRGARYGSDMMSAEGDLRYRAGNAINQQASQLALDLGNAGTARLAQLTGPLTQLAGLDQQSRESALQRLYLDSMRLTAPPPLLAGGIALTPSTGGVDNVVTT